MVYLDTKLIQEFCENLWNFTDYSTDYPECQPINVGPRLHNWHLYTISVKFTKTFKLYVEPEKLEMRFKAFGLTIIFWFVTNSEIHDLCFLISNIH